MGEVLRVVRKAPEVYEAIQYDGTNGRQIADALCGTVVKDGRRLEILHDTGMIKIGIGDWVVPGEMRFGDSYTDDRFKAEFVEAPEECPPLDPPTPGRVN